MNISRNNSLPSIALTRTDSTTLDGRSVKGEVQSSNLTLFGGTYAITPRSNGQLLNGESLAAFKQACNSSSSASVKMRQGPGGTKHAVYRASWKPGNGAADTMMDVIVDLGKNGHPTKIQASEMDFHANAHSESGRRLFNIRIHNSAQQPRS